MEALYRDNLVEHCEQRHHAAASGDAGQAVLYLLQAGEKAEQAYDNPAAIEHFTRALGLLMALPAGPDRDQREMELQLALGTPLVHIRGHAAEEVRAAHARAYELSRDAGDAVSASMPARPRRYHLPGGWISRRTGWALLAAAHGCRIRPIWLTVCAPKPDQAGG
jgi:predicted ATPase